VNLARDPLNITLILDFVLFKDLDRDLLSCEDMRPKADLAESTLPQRSTF
jgi:hypothetical protein